MEIHVQPIYLASVIALWIIFYHTVFWLVAIVRDRSLVFWSVGPFGVTVASLHEPPARRIFAQLGMAALSLTALAYINLFLIVPPPISGLNPRLSSRLVTVAIPAIILTAGHAGWAFSANASTPSGERHESWLAPRRAWPPAPASTSLAPAALFFAIASTRPPTSSCTWCAELKG